MPQLGLATMSYAEVYSRITKRLHEVAVDTTTESQLLFW